MATNQIKNTDNLINPFPGLRPFKVEESHLFFGREGQSEEILNKLSEQKFVAVIGASGSGKSSLIYCGLVPALFGGFVGDSKSKWITIASRPGNSPIDNLASAIFENSSDKKSDEDDVIKKKVKASVLRSSSNGLIEALEQTYDFKKNNILIIIDQFEELFRYKSSKNDQSTYNESEAFVKLLVTANRLKDLPVYIVLTMRSDFIGECSQFHELTELINESNYLVPQMTRDDFKKAIEGPVAVGGAEIDTQLVQQLLNEVGDNPDQLPILQHALMRTWEYWTEHSDTDQALSISDYEAIGKMEKALSEHANEAFDELNEDQKWICESMFKTITEKGNDNRGIRHPTSVADIASIAKTSVENVIKVTEPFRAAGRSFITPSFEVELNESSIIDLSHESLMRIWNKLKIWVEEEWNAVQMYLRLSEAAEMYQLGKTGLWRPPDLQLALNWREKQKPTLAWAKRYNPAFERSMVYLQTSDKEFKAEEENKVKLQKRQLRRTKIFALVLGSAAIIAMGLTVYSQTLRTRAERQERIAMEQKIEADKQRKIAEDNEKEAIASKEEADRQRKLAVDNEQRAVKSEQQAVYSAKLAEQQTQLALRREKEATESKAEAELNAEEARRQTEAAEKARQEAYRRRMQSIAQSMSVKSQQAFEDNQLKGLIAYQAYLFNETYEGPKHNPDVYLGLYYALKSLKGQTYNALNGHTGSVQDIAFKPGSNYMYTTGGDGKILKWNIDNLEEPYKVIRDSIIPHRALDITPDKKWLLCATDENSILVYNLEKGDLFEKELTGHTSYVTALTVAPNSEYFISASADKTIRKWDLRSFVGDVIIESESKINAINISPDSKNIVVGTQDGIVSVYSLNDLSNPMVLPFDNKNSVSALEYNKDGTWLVTGDSQGSIRIWDAKTYKEIETLPGHRARIYDLEFNPDNNLLASSSLDGTVKLWDCTNLNNQPIELKDHESWVLSIAFSPDGKNLVTTSNKKDRILIWATNPDYLAPEVLSRLNRNMTEEEWNTYVAKDIEYEKTSQELTNSN